jgi:hypothetical protein
MTQATRTSEGLRRILFDTLDKFLASEMTAIDAKTVAKLADSILKSAAVDLEHKRLVRDMLQDSTQPNEKGLANMGLNMVLVADSTEIQ